MIISPVMAYLLAYLLDYLMLDKFLVTGRQPGCWRSDHSVVFPYHFIKYILGNGFALHNIDSCDYVDVVIGIKRLRIFVMLLLVNVIILGISIFTNSYWKEIVVFSTLVIATIVGQNIDMCGVAGKQQTSDLIVTGLRPPLATRQIRCVLLVSSPNKWNLLSWLLIYLCNK